MGIYLNPTTPYEEYKMIKHTRFFVDKSVIIDEILTSLVLDAQKYICITRPRRFGKTVMANMLGAYFEESVDAHDIFEDSKIRSSRYYEEYINKYPVIYIDFSEISKDCSEYKNYIDRIQTGLYQDFSNKYPQLKLQKEIAIWDLLSKIYNETGQKFIFIMDEWDAVFHMPFITEEDKQNYLLFLKSMLKSKPYVELAYMTGILPIAKYSDGSELNMFDEYDMASKEKYSEYFGFLDEEVDRLYQIYQETTRKPKISRQELREWYDGYSTAAGDYLYNPRSVICALRDNQLANYWTSSGTYDSIFTYIKGNIADVRNDLVFMVSGEKIPARIQQYAATANELHTKDQIYSAIVNLVYLSARDEYRVEREDKAGKGFVDFIFYPKRKDMPGIILELKIDHTPEEALNQIKSKNYNLRFQGKLAEQMGYENKVIGVGISYNKKTKKHNCRVEKLV